jgi:AraC-like DNA-binding protein
MPAEWLTTYRCAEAVSEANRSSGWDIEYRQLKKGPYRSRFGMTELPSVLLAIDSFESLVEITGQPPTDLVMIVVPVGEQPEGILGRGRTLTSHRVDLIDANTECDWIAPPGTNMSQIYISRSTIRDTYRRLYRNDLPDNLGGLQPSIYEAALIAPLRLLTTRGLLVRNIPDSFQVLLSQDIVELSARIIAYRARSTEKRESIRNARRRIIYTNAREFIDSNLGRSIPIPEICQHSGVSVSTLERVFRRTTGLSPRAYIQSRRMNKARSLLLSPDRKMTVAEIALECGLPHFGRFSRSFHSYFGQLPSHTA